MVYIYAKQSQLNKYIGKKLTIDEITESLKDMGMDMKGVSADKDPELKVEVTAERMDLVSTVGIARAIKFYKGIQTKLPEYKVMKGNEKVIVDKSVEKVRPKVAAVILRDVPMSDELLEEMIEIQEKIHDSFGRHRKKGAIGIYPCDEIKFPISFTGEKPTDIVFHPLEAKSEMNALEILEKHDTGKKYGHLLAGKEVFPVFRDANGQVLSMPPIINSHKTGRVNNKHKDLFVEVSGHNLVYLDSIMKVMITTFMELGAKVESVDVEYSNGEVYNLNLDNELEQISLDYVNKLTGVKFNSKNIEKYLNRMMYGLSDVTEDKVIVNIPPFRADVWHDSDIADDIARGYGYNNIKARFPNISSDGETLDISKYRENLSDSMGNLGFVELYTYMLCSSDTQFKKMNLNVKKNHDFLKLANSEEQGINMIRIRILPEILESLHINRKNKYPQKVFEHGFVIKPDSKAETLAKDSLHLSCAIADPKSNYTQIKAVFDTFSKLNEFDFEIKENDKIPFLIPGRSAEIFYKKKSIGFIGELHPQVLENFGLLVPVSVFEIMSEEIFDLMKK